MGSNVGVWVTGTVEVTVGSNAGGMDAEKVGITVFGEDPNPGNPPMDSSVGVQALNIKEMINIVLLGKFIHLLYLLKSGFYKPDYPVGDMGGGYYSLFHNQQSTVNLVYQRYGKSIPIYQSRAGISSVSGNKYS